MQKTMFVIKRLASVLVTSTLPVLNVTDVSWVITHTQTVTGVNVTSRALWNRSVMLTQASVCARTTTMERGVTTVRLASIPILSA